MAETIGKGVLQVGFDAKQVEQEGRATLLPAGQRLAIDFAALFVGKKLIDIGQAGLAELKEAEVVTSQVGAVIKSTGAEAGVSADHVDGLAQSLLDVSGVDDELIKRGEALLLTFRSIRNEAGENNNIFDRATTIALDMSKAFGTDLQSSIVQVGKALESPTVGLTALRRVGVSFTADQVEQIKALDASGQKLEAQKLILAELETEFGGVAEAAGDTLTGAMDKATQHTANATASLVVGFAPALEFGADRISDFAKGLQELPGPIAEVVGGVVFLGGSLVAFAQPAGDLLTFLGSLRVAREVQASASAREAAASAVTTAALIGETAATSAATTANVEAGSSASLLAAQWAVLSATTTEAAAAAAVEAGAATTLSGALNTAKTVNSLYAQSTVEATISVDAMLVSVSSLPLAVGEADAAMNSAAGFTALYAANAETAAGATGLLGVSLASLPSAVGAASLAEEELALNSAVATEALYAESAAAGAASTSMLGMLGPLGLVFGAVAAVGVATGQFGDTLGDLTASDLPGFASRLASAFNNVEKPVRDITQSLNDSLLGDGGDKIRQALTAAGATTFDFAAAIRIGNLSLIDNVDLTEQQRVTLLGLVRTTNDAARAQLEAAVASGSLTQAAVNAAQKEATFADGTVNYVAALDNVATVSGVAADATGEMGDATSAAQTQVDALARAENELEASISAAVQAQHGMLAANLRVKTGALDIANAQGRVSDAQVDLNEARADGDPTAIAQAERDLERANIDVTSAVNSQAEATAELAAEQDAAAGRTENENEKTRHYRDALDALNQTLTGPTHDAIQDQIDQLDALALRIRDQIELQDILRVDLQEIAAGNLAGPTEENFGGGGSVHRATGGPVSGLTTFAEQGFELGIFASQGTAVLPPGFIFDHQRSEALLASLAGGSSQPVDSGVRIGQVLVQGANAPQALEKLPAALRQGVLQSRLLPAGGR